MVEKNPKWQSQRRFRYWLADSAKLASPQSTIAEKGGGPIKLHVIMFEILKNCQKCIFGQVKRQKFSRCLWLHAKQVTCHYLNQSWLIYSTRPQWVKQLPKFSHFKYMYLKQVLSHCVKLTLKYCIFLWFYQTCFDHMDILLSWGVPTMLISSLILSHISVNFMSPGVGVTKAPFVNFSVNKIFDLAKVLLRLFESHLYLASATAAELRRHLPNINVIFNS